MALPIIPILSLITSTMGPVKELIKGSRINDELKNKLLMTIEKKELELEEKIHKHQRDLIITEMNGNWMQRSWRPAFAWVVILIVLNNYFLLPYVNVIFGAAIPIVELPAHIWYLFTAGFGGYVLSRGYEKAVKMKTEAEKPLEDIEMDVKDLDKLKIRRGPRRN